MTSQVFRYDIKINPAMFDMLLKMLQLWKSNFCVKKNGHSKYTVLQKAEGINTNRLQGGIETSKHIHYSSNSRSV